MRDFLSRLSAQLQSVTDGVQSECAHCLQHISGGGVESACKKRYERGEVVNDAPLHDTRPGRDHSGEMTVTTAATVTGGGTEVAWGVGGRGE
jgi:hypothetical protein